MIDSTDNRLQLDKLNPQQKEAVTYDGKSMLILSGAGSGKTRVVTTRIAHLIEKRGASPYSILAVTFTNRAVKEMKERLLALTPAGERVLVKTFHAFGAWLLRRNCESAGLPVSYTIYDDSDSLSLLKALYPNREAAVLKKYASQISRAKDFALSPDDDLSEISPNPELNEIYKAYQDRLNTIGNVDFGDLIFKPVQLLRNNPAICNRLRQRFDHILVDEYQDSNFAQWELLRLIKGKENSICVVGDDDQSIYKFRGACIDNILKFPDYFPGTKIIKLEQNYRSTNNILSIASEVINNNSSRMEKRLWSDKEEGPLAQIIRVADQEEEAQYCVDLIKKRQDENKKKNINEKTYGETAILYRTNAQSRTFEKRLRLHKIPYKIVGALSFYSREEVKDVLAYLNFITNPKDEISFKRILNKPSRGIGKKNQEIILNEIFNTQGNWLEALRPALPKLTGKAKKGAEDFLQNIIDSQLEISETINGSLSDNEGEDPFAANTISPDSGIPSLGNHIEKIIKLFEIDLYYGDADKRDFTFKTENLRELVSAAILFPATGEGLAAFLETVTLNQEILSENNETDQEKEDKDKDKDKVTLITIHNTKGLEFKRVIISGMEEGLFPKGDEDEIEEERRLFYVGLTRAQKELYLTTASRRLIWGKYQYSLPSRFLKEIPPDLMVVKGTVAAPEESKYRRGVRIYHDEYGEGYITQTIENGGNTVIHVQFSSGRKATIFPQFSAHLFEILAPEE